MSIFLGWGLDPYGLTSYGSKLAGVGIGFQSAVALTTNSVRVVLTDAAMHVSPAGIGDALNPNTWMVQRFDTMAFIAVVEVQVVNPSTYILITLEALGPASAVHRVSSVSLLDTGGGLLIPPRHADFLGIIAEDLSSADLSAAQRGVTSIDIANPPTASVELEGLGGTLVVNAGGDYETVTGAEYVRKLIMRRLVSAPGDFFHLPDYGVGLRVKEPVPGGDLIKLKAEVERQAKLEREVEDAYASITMDANMLTIQLRAKLRSTGEQIDVTLPVYTSGVVL